jgi:hypothetical protein
MPWLLIEQPPLAVAFMALKSKGLHQRMVGQEEIQEE